MILEHIKAVLEERKFEVSDKKWAKMKELIRILGLKDQEVNRFAFKKIFLGQKFCSNISSKLEDSGMDNFNSLIMLLWNLTDSIVSNSSLFIERNPNISPKNLIDLFGMEYYFERDLMTFMMHCEKLCTYDGCELLLKIISIGS